MRYIQKSGITNKSVSGDRGAYFLSRRAHLLTTDKVGGVLPAADVRSTRFCFGTSHRNGKFALAAQHRHFHLAVKTANIAFLQSLHKKGSDRLSPYTILKPKSSQEVRDALRWRLPPI